MATLEKVQVNGTEIPIGGGLEGRINAAIERNGSSACVVVQVGIAQKSFSYAFPAGCAGGGGGGGGSGSIASEVERVNRIYAAGLAEMRKNAALIRRVVIEFIHTL